MTNTTSRTPGAWRLERPRDDRVIGGVASGIARRNDVGVGWVRLGFIIAAFFAGVGLLLYALGWLLIPNEGERDPIATRYLGRLEGASSWVGVALIGLAVLILLGATELVRGELIWAGALVLVGVLLYRGDFERAKDGAVEAGQDEEVPPPMSPPAPPAVAAQAAPAVDRKPGRPPSVLGRVTIAAILLVVGLVWLLDRAGVIFPDPGHYAALVLAITGLGLLAGTWFGRARGLIVLGFVTLPFFLFFGYVDVPWDAGWGDVSYRPVAATGERLDYRLAGGQLTIDLTEVSLDDGTEIVVTADLGFGDMRVLLPSDVGVVAEATVVGGRIDLLGFVEEGFTIDQRVAIGGPGGMVALDLRVGFGELRVAYGGE